MKTVAEITITVRAAPGASPYTSVAEAAASLLVQVKHMPHGKPVVTGDLFDFDAKRVGTYTIRFAP